MMSDDKREPALLHQFKNHLAIIVSYSDLLLLDMTDEATRKDIAEIHKSAQAAMTLLPVLAERLRNDE